MKNNNKFNYPLIFLVVLLLFGLFNVVQLVGAKSLLNEKIILEIEKAKPAQISLTVINIDGNDCPKCFDVNKIVKLVTDTQKTNVTRFVTKNFKDSDIQSKIKDLGITKFPALIIEGNVEKSSFLVKNLEKITKKISDEIYVFTPIEAPYLNNNGDLIGKVDLIALYKNDCSDCSDVDLLIKNLDNTNIYLNDVKKIDVDSLEGKKLVYKYNIEKVPTLIFSSNLKEYDSIAKNWEKGIGSIETDGKYIFRKINPLYYSISKKRVVGKIKMSVISNSDCKNCFDGTQIYSAIMSKLGIATFDKNILDSKSKEGISLINKYGLEKFPALIIEGDTNIYPTLSNVWGQVGTVENSNVYVFRNVELIGAPYFDINKGEITPTKN